MTRVENDNESIAPSERLFGLITLTSVAAKTARLIKFATTVARAVRVVRTVRKVVKPIVKVAKKVVKKTKRVPNEVRKQAAKCKSSFKAEVKKQVGETSKTVSKEAAKVIEDTAREVVTGEVELEDAADAENDRIATFSVKEAAEIARKIRKGQRAGKMPQCTLADIGLNQVGDEIRAEGALLIGRKVSELRRKTPLKELCRTECQNEPKEQQEFCAVGCDEIRETGCRSQCSVKQCNAACRYKFLGASGKGPLVGNARRAARCVSRCQSVCSFG